MLDSLFNLINFGEPLTWGMVAIRLGVALVISSVIGIDREMRNRPAGLRTHVLVCIGATLVPMVESSLIAKVAELGSPAINASIGRLTVGVLSGVGFLGAGTIVLSDRKIMGLTTAASLWCTACIGVACGFGFTTFAIIGGIIVFLILKIMGKVIRVHTYKKIEVRFLHREETLAFLNQYFADKGVKILDIDFHSETEGDHNVYTNVYTLSIPTNTNYTEIIEALSEHKNVQKVGTRSV